MLNLFKPGLILITAIGLNATFITLQEQPDKFYDKQQSQTSDAALLDQMSILCTKHIRASALAITNGGPTAANWAKQLSPMLMTFNEDIRSLAKNKKVTLSTTLPEGGQRPDGRIDSAPENLKDTARARNNGGEAGNTGEMKAKPKGINHPANNALIESLKKLNGSTFDQAYKNLLVSDRLIAEKLLTQASKSTDAELASFGRKYLKTIAQARL